ncbi:unnamed protein product [Adineta steineri]|uniref:Cap-specific mRNA (nucleoside-2'-O-)-methyltransferase n=1 Tax=Adineta steineri TaxID=433720 RepID=A0A815YG68_9BILA|nr:unnamed protein product [Adineta steineri]CAF1293876.1 unnamed protein product [Adineta steineri]CAF1570942.1 unnamed protein product [Adineta steineri]CAF1571237.1 unnamed protein product [Adineta steineri]
MSMQQLNDEIEKLFRVSNKYQDSFIKRLDDLYRKFGTVSMEKWRNRSNKLNSLLHELVEKDMPDVIEHVIREHKFDINIRRDKDGVTPLDLASMNENSNMCDLLERLGATNVQREDVSKWSSDEEKEKSMNIVWLDLEMTSIEDPHILECAVIITDKHLRELTRQNWVIGFKKEVLDSLADWHQETFADCDKGGNGLFADVLKSKITREQVEKELLSLLKHYCVEKKCPLGGSSVHIDKEVLKLRMRSVHDYLHYRIIDVSSFQGIMRRWAPWIETDIKKNLARKGQESVNHRAMDDIEWSIAFMKEFRPHLTKRPVDPNNRKHERSIIQQRRRSASPSLVKKNQSPRKNNASNYNAHGNNASNYNAHGNQGSASKYPSNSAYGNNSFDNNVQLYADEKRLLERIEQDKKINVSSLYLYKNDQEIYMKNPHLREVFVNKDQLEVYKKDFTKYSRRLPISRQLLRSNSSNSSRCSTTEHWGQRKLLLTEIEFLTKYDTDDDYRVIYAGAAPGSHLSYLSSLFPKFEFILIDEKEFSLMPTDGIKIKAENFTDDLARYYSQSKKKILFICNVRTYRPEDNGQNSLIEDMDNQVKWNNIMKPQASLLSFRLPRMPGKILYYEGHQIIEPWASKRSVECRIVVKKDAKMIGYSYDEFENSIRQFHDITRVMYYEHNMDEVENEGLDHCYDCRAEIFILQEYIKKFQKPKTEKDLKIKTAEMSADISKNIVDENRNELLGFKRTLNVIPTKGKIYSSNL